MGEAPVPQSKYHPLSLEEYQQLKEHLAGIKNFLPDHLMSTFWGWCNRLRNTKTAQPCSCASSAKHWGACVTELRDFVKRIDEQA